MQESQTPDAVLIDRFKNGDRSAMDALVTRHLPRLTTYAMRLTHDRDEASDVIGATLVRMTRAALNFKGNSSFSTYLHTATRNCFLDRRDKALARPTESLNDPAYGEDGPMDRQFASAMPSPYDLAERLDRDRSLGWAVEQLAESQKCVMTLYYIKMHTYEQMAVELCLPIGTIKSRLSRAREAIRVSLEQTPWRSEPHLAA